MDPEDYIPCPFDNTHMIRYKRFPYHVKECEKNFPNHNKVKCPFNARHWVTKPELRHHIATCLDKRSIESEIEYENSRGSKDFFGGNVSVPPYTTQYAIDPSENWDDDSDHPTFILGQSRRPDIHSQNSNNNKNSAAVEVETVFVPASNRASQTTMPTRRQEPAIEADLRMPKTVPQVLQQQQNTLENKQPSVSLGRGYGRGFAVPTTTQSSMQPFRGRGRGIMMNPSTQPGMPQFRSLSDVVRGGSPVDQSQLSNSRFSPTSSVSHKHTNGDTQLNSDSPYSSGSESPSLTVRNNRNSAVPTQSYSQQPRGVNQATARGVNAPVSWLGRGRVVTTPQSSDSGDSPGPPTHKVGVGRGYGSLNNQKVAGVGRGFSHVTNVSAPVAGIRPLDSGGSNSPCSMSDSDQFESDVERDRLKHERKLRKKLKQIEGVELKRSQGKPLLQEERDKLAQRDHVMKELELLS